MSDNEFNEKFLIHRKHAIGYFKKKFNFSNDEVEDFVQTAYLKIFKRFYNTNVDCEYPRQYLFNAVQNCIYEYVSRKNYVKKEESFTQLNIEHPTVFLDALNEIDSDLFTDNIIEKKTMLKEINYLIEKLSETHPDYSNVIKMYYFDNLTGPEIAEKLNVPVNTIKTRLFRAKIKIKELIRDKMIVFTL
jgi:RNA polymerase sigma-70 factor (ECF subfamily)